MKKTYFEIQKQIGLMRKGRIVFGETTITFPNILIPANQNLLSTFFDENLHLKEKICGYIIEDTLNILDKNNATNTEMINSIPNYINILFHESKDIYGISSLVKSFLVNPTEELNSIPILNENFPNIVVNRYSTYDLESIKSRLKLYEEIIFPKNNDQKFILEFKFRNNKEINNYIIEWINTNIHHIFGIKVTNLFKKMSNSKKILEFVHKFKEDLPSDILWILGGKIFPQQYIFAFYLGFDLIDIRDTIFWGMKGLYLSQSSTKWLRELSSVICSCKYCNEINDKLPFHGIETPELKEKIIYHNIYACISELRNINNYLFDGSIRNYLEKKAYDSATSVSFLRIMDQYYGDIIREKYPLINSYPVICLGSESHYRPEILNYIEKIKKDLFPAKDYKIILMLPCSAKKPYSKSKSHQIFQKIVKKAAGKDNTNIHQLIITSPAGIVPREIENIFPVAHYDIPVTGHWSEEEIMLTANCIKDWLKKYFKDGTSPPIFIAHLSGGYLKACKQALNHLKNEGFETDIIFTLENSNNSPATTESALELLSETIKDRLNHSNSIHQDLFKNQNALNHLSEEEIHIRATLDYQFGKGAGEIIIQRGIFRKKGRWNQFDELFSYDGAGKILFGRYYIDSGFIKLAPMGAELLIEHNRNKIKIKETNLNGTTVFRPILENLDMQMHPKDESIVIDINDNFLGVGELVQSPKDILNSSFGKICKIRKKKKQPKQISDLKALEEIEGD